MLYSFCPILAGLFLLDSDDQQFAFSLLLTKLQKSWIMKLVGAAVEFRFSQFLVAMAHFGAFHCVTFVRSVQTSLAHFTKNLRQVALTFANSHQSYYLFVCTIPHLLQEEE